MATIKKMYFTAENKTLAVKYDGTDIVKRIALQCATCSCVANASVNGTRKSGQDLIAYYGTNKGFSKAARVENGLYICGNCGRSTVWNDTSKTFEEKALYVMEKRQQNKKYRAAALTKKAANTYEKEYTERVNAILSQGLKSYGFTVDELETLYDFYLSYMETNTARDILNALEEVNYHDERAAFIEQSFDSEYVQGYTCNGDGMTRELNFFKRLGAAVNRLKRGYNLRGRA